jgi:hypothetical protein
MIEKGTTPVVSTFSTVKARTKQTKAAGSRKAGLAMACKLPLAAEKGWCRVNASRRVALVEAGDEFPNGEAGDSGSKTDQPTIVD